ncbi:MAG: NAD-dependent epimerase/dehydratase [Frankiales bacterium]|nr:NAD-dependent epimerase/dehydratase [Frankiales bacterium]
MQMAHALGSLHTVVTFVTGATGVIGAQLIARLREAGAEVHAFSRTPPSHRAAGVTWWQGDMTDERQLRKAMHAAKPTVVHHLAALVEGARDRHLVRPALAANLRATVYLLDTAGDVGCARVVVTGSALEEASTGDDGFPVPTSPYGAAKWAAGGYARMYHQLYDLPVVILRPAMTYGPGQRGKLVPYIAEESLAGRSPQLSSGIRECDWVYAGDVADAYLAAAVAPDVEGKTIDIGTGILTSVRGVADEITSYTGGPDPTYGVVPPRPMEQTVAVDPEPALRYLGWKAETSLSEGLARTVDSMRTQSPG